MAARYLNQLPANQTRIISGNSYRFSPVRTFQFHRVMLYASGWLFDPKFKYYTFVWSVDDTGEVAAGETLSYTFNNRISLGIGINALPISRSV